MSISHLIKRSFNKTPKVFNVPFQRLFSVFKKVLIKRPRQPKILGYQHFKLGKYTIVIRAFLQQMRTFYISDLSSDVYHLENECCELLLNGTWLEIACETTSLNFDTQALTSSESRQLSQSMLLKFSFTDE